MIILPEEIERQFDNIQKRLDIVINPEQRGMLYSHLLLVVEKNKELNLTSILSINAGMQLHIEDSLVVLSYLNEAPIGAFCDLGTGGGYPGIPLAIMSCRKGTLVDSSKKKANAVHDFIEALKLEHVLEARGVRAEELALEAPNKYSVVIARALTALPSLVELASPLLSLGGHLIALKGRPDDEEVSQGLTAARIVGLDLIKDSYATVGDEAMSRRILVFEKTRQPEISLPRRIGLAQKRPLS